QTSLSRRLSALSVKTMDDFDGAGLRQPVAGAGPHSSSLQVGEHPSPAARFPSSHCSSGAMTPLPQASKRWSAGASGLPTRKSVPAVATEEPNRSPGIGLGATSVSTSIPLPASKRYAAPGDASG